MIWFSKKNRKDKQFRLDGSTRLWIKVEDQELVMQIEILPEKVNDRWQIILNYSKFWTSGPKGQLIPADLNGDRLDSVKRDLEVELEKDGFFIVRSEGSV